MRGAKIIELVAANPASFYRKPVTVVGAVTHSSASGNGAEISIGMASTLNGSRHTIVTATIRRENFNTDKIIDAALFEEGNIIGVSGVVKERVTTQQTPEINATSYSLLRGSRPEAVFNGLRRFFRGKRD